MAIPIVLVATLESSRASIDLRRHPGLLRWNDSSHMQQGLYPGMDYVCALRRKAHGPERFERRPRGVLRN
jgi:hypothetical protein